jgi:flagellar hook-associated protein 2
LRNLTNQVRSTISQPVDGLPAEVNSPAMVGINIDRYGVMSLNESNFTSALSGNLNGIKALFSSAGGVATKLDEKINPYLKPNGMIEEQTRSLNNQLKRITIDREKLDKRLEQVEERLTKQFVAMDSIVGKLQSTSSYLTQHLSNFQTPK